MELDLLCNDILAEIIGRLPFEAIIKCKLVSRKWNHMICYLFSRRGSSGFIIPSYDKLDLITVNFGLADVQIKTILEKNLSTYKHWRLLASCNGLLLFMGMESSGHRHVYRICNPILNQYVNLPKPRRSLYTDSVGLAYDGIPGHHYKLIFMASPFFNAGNDFVDYEIFSSKTWEWQQVRTRLIKTSFLGDVTQGQRDCICPACVYCNGALYWTNIRKKVLLIYHVEKKFLELVKLPSYDIDSSTRTECFWSWLSESNGRLYYCFAICDTIYVWEYTREDNNGEHENDDENKNKYWRLKHEAKDGLKCQAGRGFTILCCRFCSDLEEVYIHFGYKTTLYSYSFMTREVKEVCIRPYHGSPGSYAIFFPFVFSLVDLPMKTINKQPKKHAGKKGKKQVGKRRK